MGGVAAVSGVSGISSTDPYDPSLDPNVLGYGNNSLSNPNVSGSSGMSSDSIASMGEAMHMSGQDLHKFVENLLNAITTSVKNDTEHAVQAIKDATQATQQASGG